jgi:hypothetical protein
MAEYEHDTKAEPKREGPFGGELDIPLEAAEDTSLDRRIIVKTDAVVLTLVTIVATLEFLDKNVSPAPPSASDRTLTVGNGIRRGLGHA